MLFSFKETLCNFVDFGQQANITVFPKNVGDFCPNFMSRIVLVSQGLKVRDKIARSARCPVKQVRSVRLLETFSPSKNLP